MHAAETTLTTHDHEDDDPPRPGVILGRTRSECAVWGANLAPTPVGLPSSAVVDVTFLAAPLPPPSVGRRPLAMASTAVSDATCGGVRERG